MTTNIKNIEDIAPYAGPNAIQGIRFRPVATTLGIQAWGMNVLELDPGCDLYPEHDHKGDGQEELYIVLKGSATLRADGQEHTVRAGDLVHVSPEVTRKFVTGSEGVTLVALGGTPGAAYNAKARVGG